MPALSSNDDTHRALKAQASTLMMQLGELRSLLQAQAAPSVSKPLLIALVCWLVIIFFGFSVVAPPNATSTLALGASAFAVGCAVLLIPLASFGPLGLDLPKARQPAVAPIDIDMVEMQRVA